MHFESWVPALKLLPSVGLPKSVVGSATCHLPPPTVATSLTIAQCLSHINTPPLPTPHLYHYINITPSRLFLLQALIILVCWFETDISLQPILVVGHLVNLFPLEGCTHSNQVHLPILCMLKAVISSVWHQPDHENINTPPLPTNTSSPNNAPSPISYLESQSSVPGSYLYVGWKPILPSVKPLNTFSYCSCWKS